MRFYFDSKTKYIETGEGFDLSISFGPGGGNVNAWYLDDPVISPVENGDFIGSVEKGAPVNFNNIFFNPHAHVTHTECLGHITKECHSVNQIAHPLFYSARVVSITPEKRDNGDLVITLSLLEKMDWGEEKIDALVIRTLPNKDSKIKGKYSHANPPYIAVECADFIEELGVKHLLIDLPSVDKEEDGGELAFHHAFWKVPHQPEEYKTITEFIFVPNDCADGTYLLNLQVAPIENDASPSRPVLYKILSA